MVYLAQPDNSTPKEITPCSCNMACCLLHMDSYSILFSDPIILYLGNKEKYWNILSFYILISVHVYSLLDFNVTLNDSNFVLPLVS